MGEFFFTIKSAKFCVNKYLRYYSTSKTILLFLLEGISLELCTFSDILELLETFSLILHVVSSQFIVHTNFIHVS